MYLPIGVNALVVKLDCTSIKTIIVWGKKSLNQVKRDFSIIPGAYNTHWTPPFIDSTARAVHVVICYKYIMCIQPHCNATSIEFTILNCYMMVLPVKGGNTSNSSGFTNATIVDI